MDAPEVAAEEAAKLMVEREAAAEEAAVFGCEVFAEADPLPRVCLGVTGSVAAVKTAQLCDALIERGLYIDVVVTKAASHFLGVDYKGSKPIDRMNELCALTGANGEPRLRMYRDEDEWNSYDSVGDTVLHVELAKRNLVLAIAPLCANSLANVALGLCPNLLCSLVRAWYYDIDPVFAAPILQAHAHVTHAHALVTRARMRRTCTRTGASHVHAHMCVTHARTHMHTHLQRSGEHVFKRPLLVAPAMNTYMWYQNITAEHIAKLTARGVVVVDPIAKTLACGDTGKV